MDTQKEYQKKVEAKLEEWNAEVDKLKAKAKQEKVDAESDYKKEISIFEEKKEELQARLHKLQGASEHAWEDMKEGIEKATKELQQSFDRAYKKIA